VRFIYCAAVSYFEPALPLLLLLGICGLILRWTTSAKRNRPWLETIAVFGILLLSLNAVAWLFSRPLEAWYSEDPKPAASADAIVVLAGYVNAPSPNTPYSFVGQDTYVRLQHAVWLFKHWKPLPILLCAGSREHGLYGKTMQHVLESEGVPPDLIWVESRSLSTHENALYGSEILQTHAVSRIALVVEARSMPRAAASFRKFGIDVVPVPIRFTSLSLEFNHLLPNWQAIASNGETLHEMVGLLWYRVHGWI
jgi:uncharacterized SAM-binding protein YcdF (DUF218 family)